MKVSKNDIYDAVWDTAVKSGIIPLARQLEAEKNPDIKMGFTLGLALLLLAAAPKIFKKEEAGGEL